MLYHLHFANTFISAKKAAIFLLDAKFIIRESLPVSPRGTYSMAGDGHSSLRLSRQFWLTSCPRVFYRQFDYYKQYDFPSKHAIICPAWIEIFQIKLALVDQLEPVA